MEKTVASRAALESMVQAILKQHEATKDRRPKIVRASETLLPADWHVIISPPIEGDNVVGVMARAAIAASSLSVDVVQRRPQFR
jgi:hypothetical protein